MRKGITCLVISACMASILSAWADSAVPSFRAWDLSYILPLKPTPAELAPVLKLSELGYSSAEIQAMIDHISQRFVLPESLDADSDGLSDIVDGRKIPGGPLNDRMTHNSTEPPTPFRIADEEGGDETPCFNDPSSWRAAQMRIAPYKVQPPGTPSAYLDWAKAQRLAIDRIFQVRITFRPFCATSDGKFAPLSAAMHFAFELRPSDPNLMADPSFREKVSTPVQLTRDVWGNADTFNSASRQGNANVAMPALKSHLQALNSEPYKQFRAYVIGDIAALAATRKNALTPADFKDLNDVSDGLRDSLVPLQQTLIDRSFPSLAHPGLKPGTGGIRDRLLAQLKTFAMKYATRGNVTAVAGFVTEGKNGSAFYSNFGIGAYGGLHDPRMPADPQAHSDYALIRPNGMATTAAELVNNGTFVKLTALKTSDFYAGALAVGDSVETGFAFRLFSPSLPENLVNAVDFFSQNSVQSDGKPNQHVTYSAIFPDQGQPLIAQIDKFSNPTRTIPSTTSCVYCHLLPRVGRSAPDAASARTLTLPTPNFMLLNEQSMTARSVCELDREFTKLNLEWIQSSLSQCSNPKALRECLDSGESPGCVSANCSQ